MAGEYVGDDRRLRVISINPSTGDDRAIVGEAWQDTEGVLHGRGVVAVMLFEPQAKARYGAVSLEKEISPLMVLYSRIERSPLFRAEIE